MDRSPSPTSVSDADVSKDDSKKVISTSRSTPSSRQPSLREGAVQQSNFVRSENRLNAVRPWTSHSGVSVTEKIGIITPGSLKLVGATRSFI